MEKDFVDPIVNAFEAIAKATAASDKSLLELIQLLTDRMIKLEDKVNLLLMRTKGEN